MSGKRYSVNWDGWELQVDIITKKYIDHLRNQVHSLRQENSELGEDLEFYRCLANRKSKALEIMKRFNK
jgi:hypothetical protein